MGPVPSQYDIQYQGLAVPIDNRSPWNPWSSKMFQEDESDGNWQPWNYFSCFDHKNNEYQQNSQLSVNPECITSAVCNLGKVQTKPGGFVTDQSVNLQNAFNENLMKNSQNSGNFSRKKRRKNRKRNPGTVLKEIASNNAANSTLGPRKQTYQQWNHVPVWEWSQSNSPLRPAAARFQHPFSSEYNKNLCRFLNSASSKYNDWNSQFKPNTPRANFKSDNYFARCKKGNLNSQTTTAKCLNGTNMDKKKGQESPATSNESENFKEEDDVMYLYSVDSSSEAKIVLEIDLLSDGVNLIPNSSSSSLQDSKNEDGHPIITEVLELNMPMTRKRKLSISNSERSKKSCYRLRCCSCKMSYDDVTDKQESMYASTSCSHVLCGPCISKNENLKTCPTCEIKFLSFRRLYR